MKEDEKYLPRLLLIFVIGGIIGFFYEEIFYRIDLGYFVKRGTTFGPWIPIYGFGSVAILTLANRFRDKPWKVFLYSMIITGTLEFLTGLVLHRVFQVRLWDYNVEIWNWFNIGGYICLRSVALFGGAGLALCYGIYPWLCSVTEAFERKKLHLMAGIPFCLFAADIFCSVVKAAVVR